MSDLLSSKKAKAAIAAAIISAVAVFLQHMGVNLTTEQISLVLAPLLVYILGQGVADVGKNKPSASVTPAVEPPKP